MRHGDRSTSPLSAYGKMGRCLVNAKDHGKGQSKKKKKRVVASLFFKMPCVFRKFVPKIPLDSQRSWVQREKRPFSIYGDLY